MTIELLEDLAEVAWWAWVGLGTGTAVLTVGVVGLLAQRRRSYTGSHRPDGPRPGCHRNCVATGTGSQRAHWELPTQAWNMLAAKQWPADSDGQRALAPDWRHISPADADVLGARRAMPRYPLTPTDHAITARES